MTFSLPSTSCLRKLPIVLGGRRQGSGIFEYLKKSSENTDTFVKPSGNYIRRVFRKLRKIVQIFEKVSKWRTCTYVISSSVKLELTQRDISFICFHPPRYRSIFISHLKISFILFTMCDYYLLQY